MSEEDPDLPREAEGDSLPFLTLVPNMVTTLGLCSGLTAIRFLMAGQFLTAVWLILFAIVIDGLDGLIARRLKATSDFGAQLDSLSDFLNFGVTPGFLVYQMALAPGERAGGWIFVLVYIVCCCMRLARFNVAQSRAATNGDSKPPTHFTGVPAPAGALMALLPVFIAFETGINLADHPVPVELYIVVVGLLMVSRLPTFSPKSIRVRREKIVWIMIGLALLIGIMLAEIWRALIVMILLYAISLVHSAARVFLNRRRPRP
ncbi:MAG: CDP-diacylglycerol--serine O-phosphatidyltransferase [Albidovulum sp.]|jgi:CDP-diacylglycerol--serine O-phosphatidyltransferase|uniref:CDP-diacylglycerol--serine O-phosphatidyltransferase n=2 Tax=Albidovulum sp. TaxID=1872424 RepID=UPI003034C2DB